MFQIKSRKRGKQKSLKGEGRYVTRLKTSLEKSKGGKALSNTKNSKEGGKGGKVCEKVRESTSVPQRGGGGEQKEILSTKFSTPQKGEKSLKF